MIQIRRGIFLVEMLTVIFMVGIGGTLMAVGLASLLRSQDRVVASGNRFTQVNDFLRTVKRDVRMSAVATLSESQGEGPRQILLLGEPPTQITYRFFGNHVERSGRIAGNNAKNSWSPMIAQIGVESAVDSRALTGVEVTVFVPRTGKSDPDPARRFDFLVRCAGELNHEE